MSIDRAALLKNLHLYGWLPPGVNGKPNMPSNKKPVMPEAWLDRLIKAEQVDRQARSLSYQL